MSKQQLLEIMHDYICQYGIMNSFLQYCKDDCDLDIDEVENAIDNLIYKQ